jgi:hypothetical protein
MKASLSRDPIIGLAIPPYAPKAVEKSAAAFEPLGMKLEELKDAIEVAERKVVTAIRQDKDESVAALRSGKTRDPQLLETEARAELAALEAQLPSYRQAVDEQGNVHAKTLGENIAAWSRNLDAPEAEARKRALTALATVKDADKVIASIQAARAWLLGCDRELPAAAGISSAGEPAVTGYDWLAPGTACVACVWAWWCLIRQRYV